MSHNPDAATDRRALRGAWSFVDTPEAKLPYGLYEVVHAASCAIYMSGHLQPCNCEPTYQHSEINLGS